MNNHTQTRPRLTARSVQIAFEPDAGSAVVVDVRSPFGAKPQGHASCRQIPVTQSGASCNQCEPRRGEVARIVVIHRARSA